MKKTILVFFFLGLILTISGCMDERPPEVIQLQDQYDSFRSNEFSDFDRFALYINEFSLETSHAAVWLNASYLSAPATTTTFSTMGIIVDEDAQYYYAVTAMDLFSAGNRTYHIEVYDVFGNASMGEKVTTNEIQEIALIKFRKYAKTLYSVSLATALPFHDEPVLLISHLNEIRHQMALGSFIFEDDVLGVDVNVSDLNGIIGGGIFNVNHQLVGIVTSEDGMRIATFSDILTLFAEEEE